MTLNHPDHQFPQLVHPRRRFLVRFLQAVFLLACTLLFLSFFVLSSGNSRIVQQTTASADSTGSGGSNSTRGVIVRRPMFAADGASVSDDGIPFQFNQLPASVATDKDIPVSTAVTESDDLETIVSNSPIKATTTAVRQQNTTQPAATAGLVTQQLSHFKPIMTEADRQLMAFTVRAFVDAMDRANITYHMCGGMLLGSWRHHGMVPWDDDVDVYVPWKRRRRVDAALGLISAKFVLKKAETRWKLFSRHNTTRIRGFRWRYPFVDICFYIEDPPGTISDYDSDYSEAFQFPRSVVFPLTKRPFMGMWLNAPHDTATYLANNYNVDKCQTNTYNHKHEYMLKAAHVYTVECRLLWPLYPFVFRSNSSDGWVIEELRKGDAVVGLQRLNPELFSV